MSNRARDERRRKAKWNREHGKRRLAALARELKKRHERGDYRKEARTNYKRWLRENAEQILADARREVAAREGATPAPAEPSST